MIFRKVAVVFGLVVVLTGAATLRAKTVTLGRSMRISSPPTSIRRCLHLPRPIGVCSTCWASPAMDGWR